MEPRSFDYDPSRPGFHDQIYEVYRTLRDEHPVYWSRARRVFAISRFEDVRSAASDPVTFSSEGTSISQGLLPMIQQLDPPRHDELRSLMSVAFTPRRVAEMEPRVREITRELIESFADSGSCDLYRDFALQLPSRVIGELIGIPRERLGAFLEWTESLIEVDPSDPDLSGRNRECMANIYREFAELLEERRGERRADLMSALLDTEVEGEHLSQRELLGFCFVLVVAGNDTTANLLANGAVALARHPDQLRSLVLDPTRISNAVEEMLRYESPSQALPRIATRDVTLHGVTIPKGSEVMLVWGAANRDEREFEDPDRFDVDRTIRRHLAFGIGVHHCLGAQLARLEARVGFEELLARIPEFELAAEPGWQPSVWARAHAAVPLRFSPR